MTKRFPAFLAFAVFMITGCQKTELAEISSSQSAGDRVADVTPVAAKGTLSTGHWTGYYDNTLDNNGMPVFPDPDIDPSIPDSVFIHNGVASLPWYGGAASFFSNIYFRIPDSHHISGDSMILETSVQNLRYQSLSDYDVVLELTGSLHSIQVHFVADSAYVSATGYSLGTIAKTSLPSLVHYFGTLQSIKLGTQKGQTAVYVNNKLLYRFAYKADNKIGDLKMIRLAGKGVPSFDYVKLTNSVTSKVKLTEDFNTEGQSHTIFY